MEYLKTHKAAFVPQGINAACEAYQEIILINKGGNLKENQPERTFQGNHRKGAGLQDPEELMALAKASGYELTRDEADAYLSEMKEVELTDAELKQAAGGSSCKGSSVRRSMILIF